MLGNLHSTKRTKSNTSNGFNTGFTIIALQKVKSLFKNGKQKTTEFYFVTNYKF